MSDLNQTPLHALHRELGARMAPFAGYDMPIQYSAGLKTEHLHTRASAGLFDVSHMGQLRVRGQGLQASLEAALPVDFDAWPVGQQKYTLLLNDRGGIEDDLMIANLGDEVRIVVNAACRSKDVALFRTRCPALQFEELAAGLLALQGPRAEVVLSSFAPQVEALSFMQAGSFDLAGAPCFVTRSGYTGEDGFEISVANESCERLARALLDHSDVKPVGLGARDTLRLEAGLCLYGVDISEETGIVEAGLAWAVPPSRRTGGAKQGGFPGAERYLDESRNGTPMRLIGLTGHDTVPVRHGAIIIDQADRHVGRVTSGTVSPSLSVPIALAYVDRAAAASDNLRAVVRDRTHPVKVTKLPFLPKRYKR